MSIPYAFTRSYFNDSVLSSANTFSAILGQPSLPPSFPPTPTGEVTTNHIVISEVQISGASANQDFIELYNPTSSSINLNGWRIRKKSSLGTISTLVAMTAGKIIPPQGFFLWSNSSNGFDVSIGADISNTNTLSDNNSIELQDANTLTVDQVGWGNGTNQFFENSIIATNPSAFHSIERRARPSSTLDDMILSGNDELAGNGFDTDNNSADFIIRPVSQPQNSLSSPESL